MISKLISNSIKVIIISIIISIMFFVYLQLFGIPKTQARNYYNLAEIQLGLNNKKLAEEYLVKAISYWPEEYIKQELQKISN
jgi:hypothetical protein